MTVPKSGGTPIVLASKQDGRANLAVDDVNVYWTDCGTSARNLEDGAVLKMSKQGGAPQVVVSGQSCPGGITTDAANVYWQNNDIIFKVDKRGGVPIALATNGGSAIAVDEANVYWARVASVSRTTFHSCADERSTLFRVAKNGGTPVQVAEVVGSMSSQLVMDATAIYWVNDCTNGIWKIAKTGGNPRPILSNVTVRKVAVDATQIYWTVYEDGTVMKKAK